MRTVGEILKKARSENNLTLEQVEQKNQNQEKIPRSFGGKPVAKTASSCLYQRLYQKLLKTSKP